MECDICKKETDINWGNSQYILCELHADHTKGNVESKDTKNTGSSKVGAIALFVIIVIIELTLLPIWYLITIFGMTLHGANALHFIMLAPIAAYPILIIICLFVSMYLFGNHQSKSFKILALPIAISFGWLFMYMSILAIFT